MSIARLSRRSLLPLRHPSSLVRALSSLLPPPSPLPPSFLSALSSILPPLKLDSNPYELQRHGRGESHHKSAPPQVIVHVQSEADVVAVSKLCNEHKVPIIPFGSGTSLEGHVSALRGGVSLSFCSSYNKIVSVNPESMDATVQAGVTRHQLNSALRHTGLQFMVDPGSDASLGGMSSTGASGTSAVRYGTMRDCVLGLRAVLPSGEVVLCGGRSRKNSAGYDLKGLLVGSEGTLATITEVTVKLHPVPAAVAAAVCCFKTLQEASDAVLAILQSGIAVGKCEVMDASTIEAYNKYATDVPDMPVEPHLFLEFLDVSDDRVSQQAVLAQEICLLAGGSEFRFSKTAAEQKKLWHARHNVYYAALALRKNSVGVVTDACVPLESLASLLEETAADIKSEGLVAPIFGHAGDGNFHVVLPVTPDDDEEYRAKVARVTKNIAIRAIKAGGTCTGEHGVGSGKMEYLAAQYNDATVDLMRTIKRAIDPHGIMNPGKIFDPKLNK